jgi:hypothetical protein
MRSVRLAMSCFLLSILSSPAAAAGLLSTRAAFGVLPRVCGGGYLTFRNSNGALPRGSVRFRGVRMGRLGLMVVTTS